MAIANKANAQQEEREGDTDRRVAPSGRKSDTRSNHVVADSSNPPGDSLSLDFQNAPRPLTT